MARVLLAIALLFMSVAALAADELKISQLEQDLRNLQRQVQALSRQVEELRSQPPRPDRVVPPPSSSPPATGADAWLDASKWQRLRLKMSELEVVSLLGPPTSMREEKGERVLLYALEIGSSGFLGGSVRLRDRVVVEVQVPTLQ